jgi:4-carboxymuconolactone decarboxylase
MRSSSTGMKEAHFTAWTPAGIIRWLEVHDPKVQTELVGKPVSGPVYEFAPVIDTFLKEHLFGDIFGRDVLDYQERELATVSALASLPAEAQLRSHLNVSMNVGLTEAQMREFVSVLGQAVGKDEADMAGRLLDDVLKNRQSTSAQ